MVDCFWDGGNVLLGKGRRPRDLGEKKGIGD